MKTDLLWDVTGMVQFPGKEPAQSTWHGLAHSDKAAMAYFALAFLHAGATGVWDMKAVASIVDTRTQAQTARLERARLARIVRQLDTRRIPTAYAAIAEVLKILMTEPSGDT